MNIKILGSGCKKCIALAKNVDVAVEAANVSAEIEKVTDIIAISSYGVMRTPALVINEKVVSTGKILSADEISKILSPPPSS